MLLSQQRRHFWWILLICVSLLICVLHLRGRELKRTGAATASILAEERRLRKEEVGAAARQGELLQGQLR